MGLGGKDGFSLAFASLDGASKRLGPCGIVLTHGSLRGGDFVGQARPALSAFG